MECVNDERLWILAQDRIFSSRRGLSTIAASREDKTQEQVDIAKHELLPQERREHGKIERSPLSPNIPVPKVTLPLQGALGPCP